MKKFLHIESWASSLGYVVEKKETGEGYIWHSQKTEEFKECSSVSQTIDQILNEIRSSYEGLK